MHDRVEMRAERTADAPAPAAAPTTSAPGLLALQRSAGNAAIVAMLQTGGTSTTSTPAAPPPETDRSTVRRFMSVKHFKDITYQSAFSLKDDQQVRIIELLESYAALADPERSRPNHVVVRYDEIERAMSIVYEMRRRAEIYLAQRWAPGADAQARRATGFAMFRNACDAEMQTLEEQQQRGPATAAPDSIDSSGVVQGQKTASLGGAMSWIAGIVGQLAPTPGDQGEAKLDVSVPLGAASLEIKFALEVKRLDGGGGSAGPTEVSCDLVVGGGVGIPDVVKIYAALGGYLKAEGATPDAAMKLISLGLYRRCRESEVIPRGLSAMIWGGSWGDEGTEAAEDWSLDVEEETLADDRSYVETGGVVAGGAELGAGNVTFGAKGFIGTRHDRQSMTKSKGGPGSPNPGQGLWFGQQSTGRPATTTEITFEAKAAGMGAEVKLTPKFRSTLQRVDGRVDSSTSLAAGTLEVRLYGKIPASGAAQAIAAVSAEAAKLLKRWRAEELQAAAADIDENDRARGGALRGEVASGHFVAAEALSGFAGAPLATVFSGDPDPRPLGLEVNIGGTWDTEAGVTAFNADLRYRKEYSFGGASLVRRNRIIGFNYAGGTWQVDTALGGKAKAGEQEAQTATEDEDDHGLVAPPPSERGSSDASGDEEHDLDAGLIAPPPSERASSASGEDEPDLDALLVPMLDGQASDGSAEELATLLGSTTDDDDGGGRSGAVPLDLSAMSLDEIWGAVADATNASGGDSTSAAPPGQTAQHWMDMIHEQDEPRVDLAELLGRRQARDEFEL